MKKLDSRTLKYIAKAYGKNFAGDSDNPAASEVEALTDPNATEVASNPTATPPNSANPSPTPAGFDASSDANPNVAISPDTLAQADIQPGEDLNQPASNEDIPSEPNIPPSTSISSESDQNLSPLEKAYGAEQTANTAKAQAIGEQGQAEKKAIDESLNKINSLPTESDIFNKNKANDQNLMDLYQSKTIDPNRYLNSMSTGSKILSGIAMTLGGGGAALAGQTPQAALMMDNAINRDIFAQKNDQNQALNLWKMNQQQYGNEQAADLATKRQLLTGVQYQLQSAAANAQSPLAKANADGLNAQIEIEKQKYNAMLGLNATLHGQTQQSLNEGTWNQALSTAAVMDKDGYKDAAARTLPGIGFSPSTPISEKAKDDFALNSEFSKLVQDSIDFQKTLPLNRIALTPTQVGTANSLKLRFTELQNRAQGINRLNENEIKLSQKGYNPGAVTYGDAISSLTALQKSAVDRRQSLLNEYGIVPFKDGKAGIASPQSSQPTTPAIKSHNGHQYQQVQSGWKLIK